MFCSHMTMDMTVRRNDTVSLLVIRHQTECGPLVAFVIPRHLFLSTKVSDCVY